MLDDDVALSVGPGLVDLLVVHLLLDTFLVGFVFHGGDDESLLVSGEFCGG